MAEKRGYVEIGETGPRKTRAGVLGVRAGVLGVRPI